MMTSDQATVARFLKSARAKSALELPVLSPASAKPSYWSGWGASLRGLVEKQLRSTPNIQPRYRVSVLGGKQT